LGLALVLGLIAVLSLSLTPGIADAKKKKPDRVRVMTQNLYIGSGLTDVINAGLASRTDLFADEVGEILREVNLNDFTVRARTISKQIKKDKVDLVGLQEAALWKLESPTNGGGPPRGTPANVVLIDYVDTLLNELNKKAKSKKQCGRIAKKRKAQGKKVKPCYRGYRLVVAQQRADVEQLGDFDNNPGPDGKTFDISNSASLGAAAPSRWLEGNDDIGPNIGEPPAAQCSDGIDNDGDGRIDYGPGAGNESSGPVFGDQNPATGANGLTPPWDCEARTDDSETDVNPGPPPGNTDPSGLPQDANFDHNVYAFFQNGPSADDGTPACPGGVSAECPTGRTYDGGGSGRDATGIADCNPSQPGPQDTSPGKGPAQGFDPDTGAGPIPPWPFAGYDGDEEPAHPGFQVPVCLFHGIDGDLRLQDRDVIIARKGAGVKTRNVTGGNYGAQATLPLFGTTLSFNRGWLSADVRVRGKKFRLINTHLEDLEAGTAREDQASELVAAGGPASVPKTVLIGDINSDPSIDPGPDPVNDNAESNIAFNRLTAAGYLPLQGSFNTWGHAEILNNPNDNTFIRRIDWIMTNSPSIRMKSSRLLNRFANGLWASDHGGVLSVLKVPGGKNKK